MIKLYRFLDKFTVQIAAIVMLIFFQVIANLYLPTISSDIIDKGIVNKDINYILQNGGLMLLIAAGGALCSVIAAFLSATTAMALGKILRSKIFAKVQGFSLYEFDKIGTATLITRTTNDVTQIQQVTVMLFSITLFAPLTCIGGIIMALHEDKPLTWIFLVVIPLITVIIGIVLKQGMPLFKLMQVKLDNLNLVLREGLTGIRVIRAFNRNEHEKVRFDAANKDLMENAVKVNKIMAILMPIMMLIMNLTTVAVVWFGSIRINSGGMQVGALMAFIQYTMQILFSFLMIAMVFIMIPRAAASAVRINEVLEMEPQITDMENTNLANEKKGYVEFRDVTFNYAGAEQPAISDINFTAMPGETTAIIGGTGSGKSTLVNLIPRFYDTQRGSVLIDGVDVREISQENLRAKIGFVPQKNILFSGTIAENIRYGKKDATLEEIRHAAEVAQATDFISAMEETFDHYISQGGTNVSGGQKQRLSIARALVRKPEIYIFDDSFSALDFKTDAKLRLALKKETVAATVILIAQRVTTVMDADRIIVLDEGKVAGIGTHHELMNNCQVYSEIVASQLSKEELQNE
jgi:ATP-binding cassette subfamily B protein